MTMTRIGCGMVVLALVVLATACLEQRGERGPLPRATSGHWVHTQRLQDVMRRIQAATSQNWPQELDDQHSSVTPEARQAALDEACVLAQGLAEAAERIPDGVKHVRMEDVDRRSFQAQVDTLRDQAQELDRAGQAGDVQAMESVLDRIAATCASCHQRFRDYAGPMKTR